MKHADESTEKTENFPFCPQSKTVNVSNLTE